MYHIGFCGDDKYMKFIAVAMYSIIKNTDKAKSYKNLLPCEIVENQDGAEEKYCFHIVTDGISENTKNKLMLLEKDLNKIYPCSLEIHTADGNVFAGLPKWAGSYAIYLKILLLKFLPSDVRYALYLDGDTLIKSDIRQVFMYDMLDNWIGGALDVGIIMGLNDNLVCKGRNGTADFSYRSFKNYINAGLVMFNVRQCLAHGVLENFYRPAEKYHLNFSDQDCFNMVCNGKIYVFPFKWNVMYPKHVPLERFAQSCLAYDQKNPKTADAAEGMQDPAMLHFSVKPWKTDGFLITPQVEAYWYPNISLWWEYAEEIPSFKNELRAAKTEKAYRKALQKNAVRRFLYAYSVYRYLYKMKIQTRPFFRKLEQPFKRIRNYIKKR